MTKSGKLKSYWSMVSNIAAKSTGTSEKAKENRKTIYKLSGVKISTFPTQKQVRKAISKWKKKGKKLAKAYQKEQLRLFGKKISLKQALESINDMDVNGYEYGDFPNGESP